MTQQHSSPPTPAGLSSISSLASAKATATREGERTRTHDLENRDARETDAGKDDDDDGDGDDDERPLMPRYSRNTRRSTSGGSDARSRVNERDRQLQPKTYSTYPPVTDLNNDARTVSLRGSPGDEHTDFTQLSLDTRHSPVLREAGAAAATAAAPTSPSSRRSYQQHPTEARPIHPNPVSSSSATPYNDIVATPTEYSPPHHHLPAQRHQLGLSEQQQVVGYPVQHPRDRLSPNQDDSSRAPTVHDYQRTSRHYVNYQPASSSPPYTNDNSSHSSDSLPRRSRSAERRTSGERQSSGSNGQPGRQSARRTDNPSGQLYDEGHMHPPLTASPALGRNTANGSRESLNNSPLPQDAQQSGSRLSSTPPAQSARQNHHQQHQLGAPTSAAPPGASRSSRPLQEGSTSNRTRSAQLCAKCNQPMTGQFVRALGTVFHLDCFRCQDCNKVVAAKFFPVDGVDGRQYPLCETDYFRRLSLICAQCGAALRGSYITALDMKFHVEHFTCSVCPTVFGPQDSYYEHAGRVYCHFHYSTRFAVKCTGCKTAILKQFVEINRNNVDEHWHPECYMIHKFWNIKLVPTSKKLSASTASDRPDADGQVGQPREPATTEQSKSQLPITINQDYAAQEAVETAQSLREKQKHVENQVYRIWTVLSTFEESSAACISEMLRHVSNGHYLDAVRLAEKFVLHVETLFAAIDDLNAAFRNVGGKEIPHVREARMLCKKVVNFFSLLSHTHETGPRKMGITQELLSLVTGLAHYLKILIRIALTAALKLEREHATKSALNHFLSRLDRLCKDPDALKTPSSPSQPPQQDVGKAIRPHGYKSLARPGASFIGQGESISDLCEECKNTVEEDCVRFGLNLRWHLGCLACANCRCTATKDKAAQMNDDGTVRTKPLQAFRIETSPSSLDDPAVTESKRYQQPLNNGKGMHGRIFCADCPSSAIQDGFEYVTRLEQYAFLLCVALNKLYRLLKQRGVMSSSVQDNANRPKSMPGDDRSIHETYRHSNEIRRMKSVNLDRKHSTTARVAQRLTVVETPFARTAQANEHAPANEGSGRIGLDVPQTSQQGAPNHRQPMDGGHRLPGSSTPTRAGHLSPPEANGQLPAIARSPQLEDTSLRPAYNRSTTAIRVVEDTSQVDSGAFRDTEMLGSDRSPVQDEEGITLADLHSVMEAEQAREQQRILPKNAQLLSELSALEYLIVKHAAAITLASDLPPYRDFAQLDDLLDIIDVKKNNFWGKLFKASNKDKKDVKKKGVFGIPLETLIERHGADSMLGAGPGSVRVPMFIDDVITAMKQMDLSVEGIFRKNGNIRRLNDLKDAIDRDADSVNLQDDNPVQIAALLKRFLRELPDPLLTFRLQHLWLATQRIEDEADRKQVLHLVCCLMPKCHRDTMEVLFVFLKWVASFAHVDEETGSKMDLPNLATVICPSILYSKGKDTSKDESFLGIQAVTELLLYQDELFTVPPELTAILSDQDLFLNPSELSSKDILKKAEIHLREHHRKRQQGLVGDMNPPYPNGHRGEVKHTHPHVHAPFSPPMHQQGSLPSPAMERPVSWQAQHQNYPGPNSQALQGHPMHRTPSANQYSAPHPNQPAPHHQPALHHHPHQPYPNPPPNHQQNLQRPDYSYHNSSSLLPEQQQQQQQQYARNGPHHGFSPPQNGYLRNPQRPHG